MWEEECLRFGALLLLRGCLLVSGVAWAEGGLTELPWLLVVLSVVLIMSLDME